MLICAIHGNTASSAIISRNRDFVRLMLIAKLSSRHTFKRCALPSAQPKPGRSQSHILHTTGLRYSYQNLNVCDTLFIAIANYVRYTYGCCSATSCDAMTTLPAIRRGADRTGPFSSTSPPG